MIIRIRVGIVDENVFSVNNFKTVASNVKKLRSSISIDAVKLIYPKIEP